MGMYTQIRGFLNIGDDKNAEERYLKTAKKFKEENEGRTYVADYFRCVDGRNTTWILIGIEHKDYDDSIDVFLHYLFEEFKSLEGRIEKQREAVNDITEVYIIKDSEIVEQYEEESTFRGNFNFANNKD